MQPLRCTFALVSLAAHIASSVDADLTIASFDGSSTLKWATENDPVMGGQSISTFVVDAAARLGVWKGQVRIVPFLHAAGFCTVHGSGDIPSIADYKGIAVTLQPNTGTNISNFQVQFMSSDKGGNLLKGGQFIGDFSLTPSAALTTIFLPFSSFIESWRGEKVGGAPSPKQLASIIQIGLGSDGKVGDFNIGISKIVATNGAPTPSPAGPVIELVTFASGSEHKYNWIVVNDPVMGGLSHSTFRTDEKNGIGIFNGTVAIVPSLKAPGFCNAEARSGVLAPKFPDISSMLDGGGLLFNMTSTGPLSSFKAAFGTVTQYNFGSYKSDFNVTIGSGFKQVFIPFTSFSNKWSAATGEPTTRCSPANPEVCPTAKHLADIGTVGIWAEGMAGSFHVEIQSICATMGKTT